MFMPLWIRLGSFSGSLVILSFFLKGICPISNGCLTAPLVVLFFQPLFFVEQKLATDFSVVEEIIFLIFFWFILGALLGVLLDLFKQKDRELVSENS